MLAVPAVLVVFFRRYLPESPRFLLSKGRIEDANKSLTRSGRRTASGAAQARHHKQYVTEADIPVTGEDVSYAEVFKGENLKRTIAIGAASWMSFGAQVTLLFLMPILLVSRGLLAVGLAGVHHDHEHRHRCSAPARRPTWRARRRGGSTVTDRRRAGLHLGHLLRVVRQLDGADPGAGHDLPVLHDDAQHHARRCGHRSCSPRRCAPWAPRSSTESATSQAPSCRFAALFFFDRCGVAGVFAMIAVMYALLVVAARFGPETFGKPLEAVTEKPVLATRRLIRHPTRKEVPNMLTAQHLRHRTRPELPAAVLRRPPRPVRRRGLHGHGHRQGSRGPACSTTWTAARPTSPSVACGCRDVRGHTPQALRVRSGQPPVPQGPGDPEAAAGFRVVRTGRHRPSSHRASAAAHRMPSPRA